MYTASHARKYYRDDLDQRIQRAVEDGSGGNGSYLRVYIDDPWCRTIKEELERRGFVNVNVPDICLCGDVYFEWPLEEPKVDTGED